MGAQFEWADPLPPSLRDLEEAKEHPLYQLIRVIHEKTRDTPSDIRTAEQLKECAAKDKDFWNKNAINCRINDRRYKYENGRAYVIDQLEGGGAGGADACCIIC